jgi:type IV pilus assembly protein PilW
MKQVPTLGLAHRQAPGQRGMTLIELMVAMTIGLFLMLVLSAAYLNGAQLFRTQNQLAEIQDNGRSAIEVLTREVRMAGYLGCVNETVAAPFTTIQGYDSLTDYGSTPAGAFTNPTGPVLVIRHGAYQSIPVTAATTATSVTAGPDVFGWNATTPQLLISDCVAATAFTASAINGTNASTTITAAAGTAIPAYDNTARVRPVETSTFFLATPTGHSQPSLYQRYSNGYVNQDLRVADNVGTWRLSYASGANDSQVDATAQSAQTVAASVGGWASVKSLRVDLSLISSKPVLSEPASYWFNFSATTPTDNYLRKEMASTLALRNRIQLP